MPKTLEEKLIEDINKSGYPLEIEISSILDDKWDLFNNAYYLDKNTGKEREIDIVALRTTIRKGKSRILFTTQVVLVIECKKSNTHAWVFFSRPTIYAALLSGQYLDFVQVKTNDKSSLQNEIMTYIKGYHYDEFEKVASTYAEYKIENLGKNKKKRSQKEEIFTAVQKLKNYIIYDKEMTIKEKKDRSKFINSKIIRFYFPTIVFDGKLYECTIEGLEPQLQETNHVLIHFWHPEGLFYIDVVKREHFNDFIKDINEEKDKIFKKINENYLKIKKSVENTEIWRVQAAGARSDGLE